MAKNERGAILVMSVAGIILAVISSGLAVDLGRLGVERRVDQKVADLAALDAVRALPDATAVLSAARTSALQRNKFDYAASGNSLTAEVGQVNTAGDFVMPGTSAVRVTIGSHIKNAFIPGEWSVTVKAIATLGNGAGCALPDTCVLPDGNPLGTVRVGSKFASLSGAESTILNRLLTQVLGGSYNLDLVSYQGLAAGNVEFGRLRTALGLGLLQVNQLGSSTFSFRQILDATVTALNQQGDSSSTLAATKLATIAAQVNTTAGLHFDILKLLDVAGSAGSGPDVATASINVLDILRSGLVLADSDHFAQFDLLSASNDIPVLQTLLPNFVSARVKFGLIEAPQMKSGAPKDALGNYRTVAHTSQVRLLVEITHNITPVGVPTMQITVPYYIDAGTGTAKLDTLTCAPGNGVPSNVKIFGETSPATVNIGTVTNPALSGGSAPTPGVATLANVNLAGLIHVTTATNTVTTTSVPGRSALLTFLPDFTPTTPASQPVPGTGIVSVPTVGSSNLTTTVTVAGLLNVGLGTNVSTAVVNAVTGSATPLMNALFSPLFKALGLTLGGADVWSPPVQQCNPSSYTVDPPPGPIVSLPSLVG
jgi:uncharacterized membrane protein